MKHLLKLLILLPFVSFGQNNNYYNQTPPVNEAELFAPGVFSTYHHEHSRLEFSKDGNAIFWAVIPIDTVKRNKGESPYLGDKQTIWHVYKTKKGWTKPEILPFTTDSRSGAPALTLDQNALLFYKNDPNTAEDVRPKKANLLSINRKGKKWGDTEIIEDIIPKVEGKVTMAFTFADNGNVYYDLGGPSENGYWSWKIYYREWKDGKYGEPIMLKNKIDISEVNWCPFVAPDESYLIFSSDRYPGLGGGDLFICFKDKNDNWTEPINMGDKVNSINQERFPSVTPDGKYLFFARHQQKTYSDYFWVDAKVINELKKSQAK